MRSDRGKVGEREVAPQGNAFLVDELVVNFVPDLGVFSLNWGTEDDDRVFGHICLDRDAFEGHGAGGGQGDPANQRLGSVLTGRVGMRDRWRGNPRGGTELFWRGILE